MARPMKEQRKALKLPQSCPRAVYDVIYKECGGFVDCEANPDVIWEAMLAEVKKLSGTMSSPPNGWKLVPIEPTEEMVIRGFESAPGIGFIDHDEWEKYQAMSGCEQAAYKARLCWAAMLAAAPKVTAEKNSLGKST